MVQKICILNNNKGLSIFQKLSYFLKYMKQTLIILLSLLNFLLQINFKALKNKKKTFIVVIRSLFSSFSKTQKKAQFFCKCW